MHALLSNWWKYICMYIYAVKCREKKKKGELWLFPSDKVVVLKNALKLAFVLREKKRKKQAKHNLQLHKCARSRASKINFFQICVRHFQFSQWIVIINSKKCLRVQFNNRINNIFLVYLLLHVNVGKGWSGKIVFFSIFTATPPSPTSL